MMNPDPSAESQPLTQTEIYLAAAELHGGERARYLESVCGPDTMLRARVEALLAADEPPEDFLEDVPEPPKSGDAVAYFGDYVLLDEIARGASGVVFRARQASLNRVVALKMLRDHGHMASLRDQQRFRGEAEAVAKLDHPGIVPIYEVGEHAGQGYFSMKFIEGGTLQLRGGEFREHRKAASLIAKVARAVHHAHEHGILHRDLKPGNILLDRHGEPQVVDFGIARNIGLDSSLTHTGQILGTPHYMPPEQARGENSGLTAAADVYSLGAILYELLAGKKLFEAETMLNLLKQVVEEPPGPLNLGDRDLENIVRHCLEKSPADRYESAAELAEDLDHWQLGEPVRARSVGPLHRMAKWMVRRPTQAALVAMSLIAIASLAAYFLRGPASAQSSQRHLAVGSPAASRRAAEWLLQIKGSPSFVNLRLVADQQPVEVFSGQGLPGEDFQLEHVWLDRYKAPADLPLVTDQDFASYLTGVTHLKSVMVRRFFFAKHRV